ncbi:ThiF family adenylyltransferase [Segatella paludivivens]|uniref:ThiF family adenylyltransferase n=1 Tax=Segatella paludivivens TaxID=185294 RepID=UPI00037ACA60|nr:ThiF family adenylyltransferase [Segatella paludivivens]
MKYKLRLIKDDYNLLQSHLLGNSGKEAAAIGLCGRCEYGDEKVMTLQKVVLIPYNECYCSEDNVSWSTNQLIPLLKEAADHNYAILKIHSHPKGGRFFSKQDNHSDDDLFSSIIGGWCESDQPHISAIMLPDGEIYGRAALPNNQYADIYSVMVVGEEIDFFYHKYQHFSDSYSLRTIQTFGEGTYSKLKQLKIGVVGCSGTGSITIEQLMRYCVGDFVLVDPDIIESKNLNRLVGSKQTEDCIGMAKVDFYKNQIIAANLGSKVNTFKSNICNSKETLQCLSTCDIIFGCMDSASGRNILNRLCTFCLIPYFDMGVYISADGHGGIDKISTAVHYLQPAKSTLYTRKAYDMNQVNAELMELTEPERYKTESKEGYVKNANVESPAVISINCCVSSIAVIEMLNRISKFKNEPAEHFSKIVYDISEGAIIPYSEDQFEVDDRLTKFKGKGWCKPYLDIPTLS